MSGIQLIKIANIFKVIKLQTLKQLWSHRFQIRGIQATLRSYSELGTLPSNYAKY